jgi:hypothetical protein
LQQGQQTRRKQQCRSTDSSAELFKVQISRMRRFYLGQHRQ